MRVYKNLDIYLTIILSIVASGLGILGIVDQPIVQGAILALIALVSFSLLANRLNSDEVKRIVNEIKSHEDLPERFFAEKFNGEKIKNLLSESSKTYLLGVTLQRTIPYLSERIEESIRNGCEVRILLAKPNSEATRMASLGTRKTDQNQLDSHISNNITMLSNISMNAAPGKLRVRVVEYLPPYSLGVFSPNLSSGVLFVRLLTFKASNEKRPTFYISKGSDYWFSYFVNQFESMWDMGEDVQLQQE